MTGVQTCALPICFPVTIEFAQVWFVCAVLYDGIDYMNMVCNYWMLLPIYFIFPIFGLFGYVWLYRYWKHIFLFFLLCFILWYLDEILGVGISIENV